MKKSRENSGVTLIALVITIIVLLILASVSIKLFGQEGIITKARDTGEKTADAGIRGDLGSLYDVVDGVPIPKGFQPSGIPGENTKAEGLVIIDEVNGNEFVWVPVKDLEQDGTMDGTNYNQQFGRRVFGRTISLGGTAQIANRFTENIEENDSDLIQSVEKYGGFYIARYEASYEDGKVVSKPSTTATEDSWTPTNGRLWNYISQLDAITICNAMYGDEAEVKAHLPYGAEWDSILQWFKQTEFSNSNTPIGEDSTTWGNYYNASFTYGEGLTKALNTETLINTGSTEYTKVNNIYDMAGNLMEWTQEKRGTETSRASRGGDCASKGSSAPAGYRYYRSEPDGIYRIGFRPSLYIK